MAVALVISAGNPPPVQAAFNNFGSATVIVDFEVNGAGSNIDTIAFWEASDPTNSLMFVTSKSASLVEVWKYPFKSGSDQLSPLRHSCLGNQGANGVLVDQQEDKLYLSIRFSRNICVFSLPNLQQLATYSSGVQYDEEPNLALLKLTNGQKRLYVSDERTVYIHDTASGQKIGQFAPLQPSRSVEAMYADDFYQLVYIPDERGNTGIYPHKPDGSTYSRNGESRFAEGVFQADAEGIWLYTCPGNQSSDNGEGLVLASDQIESSGTGNDYEVFDRQSWDYLGKIKLERSNGSKIYNTDGIALTQQSSSLYPQGLFTAVHSDTSVVGVSWEKILSAAGLSCGTGGPTPTPATILGDANGDGKVDGLDYVIWLNNYNQQTGNGAKDGDFNTDGKVDGLDYVIWLNSYGK